MTPPEPGSFIEWNGRLYAVVGVRFPAVGLAPIVNGRRQGLVVKPL